MSTEALKAALTKLEQQNANITIITQALVDMSKDMAFVHHLLSHLVEAVDARATVADLKAPLVTTAVPTAQPLAPEQPQPHLFDPTHNHNHQHTHPTPAPTPTPEVPQALTSIQQSMENIRSVAATLAQRSGHPLPQAPTSEIVPAPSEEDMKKVMMGHFIGSGSVFARALSPNTYPNGKGTFSPPNEDGSIRYQEDLRLTPAKTLLGYPQAFYTNSSNGSTQMLVKTKSFNVVLPDLGNDLDTPLVVAIPENQHVAPIARPIDSFSLADMKRIHGELLQVFGLPIFGTE